MNIFKRSLMGVAVAAALSVVSDHAVLKAAKAGVTGLTRTAAAELGPNFVRVNCICPGGIVTPISKTYCGSDFDIDSLRPTMAAGQPIPRPGEPTDIAGTALWPASDDSGYVSGQIIAVDGGAVAEAFRPAGSGDGTTGVSFVTKD